MNNSYFSSVIKIISSSKPSRAIHLLLMVLFVSSFANVAYATTYYTNVNGTPSTLANWWTGTAGTGSHPANFTNAADIFIIQNGDTMTTTTDWTVSGSVIVNNGGVFAATSSNTDISLGALTINSGGLVTMDRQLTVTGVTNITGTIDFGSTSGTSRAITFNGAVTLNSGAVWTEPASGDGANNTYDFADNFTNNATTFNAFGTGIHTFSGTTKILTGSNTTTIPKVEVTGSYTNNGVLSVSTALSGGGALTNSLGSTLTIGGTSSITNLANAGTTTVNGSGAISTTLANFTNTGTLNLNGSGSITGITNNAGGIVNLTNSGTITSFNNATATSVFNISDTTVPTITTLTASIAGNTVNYNGANQTVKATTYSNLTLSGSGTKTFSNTTTISNILSIETGVIANLGTKTHTASILTLGGQGTVPGSWGSTSSTATNKDNTYFAATTGIVNNNCTAPSITLQPTALTICENTGGSFSVAAIGASTYQWQYSGNNSTWVNIDASLAPYVSGFTTDTFNLSNTPAAWTGNYVRCAVRSSTGCRTNSNSVQLTVNPTLTAPTVGTITQPTCSTATGSVVLSGLPTGSWSLTRSSGSVTTTGTGTSTTISGLVAGTTYTYSVDTANNGTGLKGEYFNNMTLAGSPTLTRTDAAVNFNWGTSTPDASIPVDGFSVRWSGLVQPLYSETYTFSTVSDDGIRLWVNGVQIINQWNDHGSTTYTGTILLTAGVKYNIVLEYYENGGSAVSQLSWSSASQTSQFIPTTQLFPVGSCPSLASANIVINTQPATPAAPTGTAPQSFCSSNNPTVANLAATGTAIQWYAAASGGSALATTTALVNGTHYYASQTVSGCESATRFDVTASVSNPAAPTGSAFQYFCSGATVANLSATGTAIQWYSASSGGSALATSTALVNGNHYYATQTISGCESTTRFDVTVTVSPTLSAPTIGTITQPTCSTATGSVVLNGLPTGSWSLTRSPGSVTTTGTGTSTTISGLAAGTTYTYSINGLNNGLKGEYFNNMTLAGSPVLTRTDATVNFDWVNGTPDASVNSDIFSVRWSGLIQPLYSETYTFSTRSDDGIRLWVNGVQVINNWTNHSAATDTGTIVLTAGVKYSIVLEYFENTGQAVSQLSWSSPSQSSQIISTSQLFPMGSCPSPASANIVINAQPTPPAAPTGTASQSFCSSSNPTVASLTATGTTIQWYAASSGGSALATTTALVNGNHYYATQTNVSGCESTTRFDVAVTVNTAPSAPATAGPYNATCSGFTAQWAWTANATTYFLDVATDSGFTSIVPTYNNLNVGNVLSYAITGLNAATTYYYRVRASGCSTSSSSATMSIATSSVAVPSTAGAYSATCTGFTAQWGFAANATTYYLDVATDSGFTSIVPTYNNLNVGNILNYTLTGLNPGTTYFYRVRASGCGTSANSATMSYATTASPATAPTASAATSPGCDSATLNWNSIANATGYYLDIATDSSFTTFVSGYNNLYVGYSGGYYAGGLPAGTLYYRVRATNNCGVTTGNSNTISFSTSTPSTPIVGTITQPDCVNGGSVVLSNLPASGTIYQTGTVVTNYPITGTSMTISGLAAGTYAFSVSNGSCTSSSTGNVIFNAVVTNTWNGTAWDNGTPTASQALIFNGNYPPTPDPNVDITGCSCTINSGKNVTIKTGRNLIITNEVTVIGTGTLTFENNASLIQTNNVTNVGSITYKRATTTIREFDFTYWSSPVAGQKLLDVSPTTKLDKFFSFNAAANDWVQETPSTTTMDIGKGYIIRGIPLPTPPAPGFYEASFIGVPNNGPQSIAVVSGVKYNLIGNPYPSAIDADAFILANTAAIDGTLYFWTHNTPIAIGTPDPGTGVWAYSGNDYATYTLSGGTGTAGNFVDANGNGIMDSGEEMVSNRPTGKIAAGQSFFTTSTAGGGPVNFTNAMRVNGLGDALDNTKFYKTKNPKSKTTTTIEKNRVWLNLTNKQGAFKQTLVGYITGASNTWDKLYDGESFDGNDFLDFYSINDEKNLTIQGRALPFDENDEIPLGYRIAVEGTFTINIDETDGLLTDQPVFLEDKLTNKTVNLKEGKYDFNTSAGTFNDRFVLRYTSKTLGTNDLEISSNKVLVSIKNKQIKIDSFAETIDQVAIYDEAGRQIYQKNKVNSTELSISNLVSNHQILIVKTSLQNGKTVSNKIIY